MLDIGLVAKELEKQFTGMKKTITTTMKKSGKSMIVLVIKMFIVMYVCVCLRGQNIKE